MANNIQSPGVTTILNSSSTGPGSWYRVAQRIGHLSFQVIHTASGATVSSVVGIETSNDGINPNQTVAGSVTLTGATAPGADGLATDAGWAYVRANTSSISTGSIQVLVNAQYRP